jgi:tungstate transport system ATP-binding protein
VSTLIEVRDLLVVRGGLPALQLADLKVEKGEILAVVGPNGAGKSTLLLALGRLLPPQRGRILFDGQPAAAESDTDYRRRIALVMQDPLLFDTSVFDNVAAGLRFRGIDKYEIRRRVPLWLERLGIPHLEKRRAPELSGGEAQRVSLARALALEPQLLLLDEPFSALDPPTRLRLVDDLSRLLREGQVTTVFVTHNLDEAAHLADRVAIFLGGQLRQHGQPEQISKAPADPEVAAFLGGMVW